jgi:hypothetical protein
MLSLKHLTCRQREKIKSNFDSCTIDKIEEGIVIHLDWINDGKPYVFQHVEYNSALARIVSVEAFFDKLLEYAITAKESYPPRGSHIGEMNY